MLMLVGRRKRPKRPPSLVVPRIPLYHPDFPVILLWSQKAGCTTVVNWFFDQVGLLGEARRYHPWVHSYEVKVYKARHGYRRDTREAMASGRYRLVKVVRDPFRRAASAFLALGDRPGLQAGHWSGRYWHQAADWLGARGLDAADGLSFAQHLDHVAERTATRWNTVDLHVARQYHPREEEVIEEVVPIERFAEWAARQAAERGLKASDFSDIGNSVHHHRSDPARTARFGERPETYRLKRGEFADNRFPDATALINPRSVPKLHAAYGADVAAYGHLYDIPPAG